jgi:hypothetical protein
MTRIELGHQPLDRAALAGGIVPLEQRADGRSELAIADQAPKREPELAQPRPGGIEPLRLLILGELE